MLNKLIKLPRWIKRLILVIHDVFLVFFCFWLAIGLRLSIGYQWQNSSSWQILAVTLFVSAVAFIKLGLYRTVIRYAGSNVLTMILWGCIASAGSMLAAAFYFHIPLPRSIPIMYFLLLFVLMIGTRFAMKGLLMTQTKISSHPVVIYGAGDSGRQLLESIKQVDKYYPVAFVDDNKSLHNSLIYNLCVYSAKDLPNLIEHYSVKTILLAIPSATSEQRKKIITNLEKLPCAVLTMPGMKDLVEGKVTVSSLKKVSVAELLGRARVAPDRELMQKNISGKVVMVTGAGGSIGSELCRQIIHMLPEKLILFELSEFLLYQIEKDLEDILHKHQLEVEIIPAMGSVQHKSWLIEIMKRYSVNTVYHAAAYKHVPLVEYNTIEGVKNNVFGTLRCAQAAIDASVETFVLISTDKAVRPTNTMGATKRMAELILQALAEEKNHTTCFCMVRFGNVLGSSGSVIPLFEKQIANGGPITLTHKDITRFFMTIPEAAQLVIQAGAMGIGGDVFLLDMGKPIRIIEMAKKMVHLSGLQIKDSSNPDGDIEIVITGLRPGEKLYEELLVNDNAAGTNHRQIMTSKEDMMPLSKLMTLLSQIEVGCDNFDPIVIRELLLAAPLAFSPSNDVCDLLTVNDKGK